VPGRLDGFQDELVLAVEDLDRLQSGADPMNLAASDAWADVRRDAWADEFPGQRRLGADAGKSAGLELACPEQDDPTSDVSAVARLLLAAPPALPALDKLDEAPSEARSCADPALASVWVALRVFELGLDSLGFEPDRQERTAQ
jgi:hypothetical protein